MKNKIDKNQNLIDMLNETLHKQKLHVGVVRTTGKYKYAIVDNYSGTQEFALLSAGELEILSNYFYAIKNIDFLETNLKQSGFKTREQKEKDIN